MADTRRDYAAIIALLADNTSGQISAQDMRDVVRTISPDLIAGYDNSTGGTTSTPVSARLLPWSGTEFTFSDATQWTVNTSSISATWGGTSTVTVLAYANITYNTGANDNQDLMFAIGISGTPLAYSRIYTQSLTGTDRHSVTVVGFAYDVDPSQTVGVYVTNETNTSNAVTVEAATFGVMALPYEVDT